MAPSYPLSAAKLTETEKLEPIAYDAMWPSGKRVAMKSVTGTT
jgi:hypothetical protein